VVAVSLPVGAVESEVILEGYTKIVSEDLKDYNVEKKKRETHVCKTNVMGRPIIK
jgi:hypothetical protein